MTTAIQHRSLTALRLVLGVVVLQQACLFVFSPGHAGEFTQTGLPSTLRMILGWTEIVAAILFLAPWTVAVGAGVLCAVFLAAAGVHVIHGDFNVGGLIVYLAAAAAVWVHRAPVRVERRSDNDRR